MGWGVFDLGFGFRLALRGYRYCSIFRTLVIPPSLSPIRRLVLHAGVVYIRLSPTCEPHIPSYLLPLHPSASFCPPTQRLLIVSPFCAGPSRILRVCTYES
ncbi:hypothetical protein GSI_06819 [Ganoderma sinense ZZ0214-1]|uniref:Uncharacterized protein n=1 Tax=Ganoderma sinense ZZ0214-1 TaxID=1077348 RepID=A0A2G8SED5_9APHY|nr:hypothetical protein GSI_06819 [Ganoderma sinense ZZ0214-1]